MYQRSSQEPRYKRSTQPRELRHVESNEYSDSTSSSEEEISVDRFTEDTEESVGSISYQQSSKEIFLERRACPYKSYNCEKFYYNPYINCSRVSKRDKFTQKNLLSPFQSYWESPLQKEMAGMTSCRVSSVMPIPEEQHCHNSAEKTITKAEFHHKSEDSSNRCCPEVDSNWDRHKSGKDKYVKKIIQADSKCGRDSKVFKAAPKSLEESFTSRKLKSSSHNNDYCNALPKACPDCLTAVESRPKSKRKQDVGSPSGEKEVKPSEISCGKDVEEDKVGMGLIKKKGKEVKEKLVYVVEEEGRDPTKIETDIFSLSEILAIKKDLIELSEFAKKLKRLKEMKKELENDQSKKNSCHCHNTEELLKDVNRRIEILEARQEELEKKSLLFESMEPQPNSKTMSKQKMSTTSPPVQAVNISAVTTGSIEPKSENLETRPESFVCNSNLAKELMEIKLQLEKLEKKRMLKQVSTETMSQKYIAHRNSLGNNESTEKSKIKKSDSPQNEVDMSITCFVKNQYTEESSQLDDRKQSIMTSSSKFVAVMSKSSESLKKNTQTLTSSTTNDSSKIVHRSASNGSIPSAILIKKQLKKLKSHLKRKKRQNEVKEARSKSATQLVEKQEKSSSRKMKNTEKANVVNSNVKQGKSEFLRRLEAQFLALAKNLGMIDPSNTSCNYSDFLESVDLETVDFEAKPWPLRTHDNKIIMYTEECRPRHRPKKRNSCDQICRKTRKKKEERCRKPKRKVKKIKIHKIKPCHYYEHDRCRYCLFLHPWHPPCKNKREKPSCCSPEFRSREREPSPRRKINTTATEFSGPSCSRETPEHCFPRRRPIYKEPPPEPCNPSLSFIQSEDAVRIVQSESSEVQGKKFRRQYGMVQTNLNIDPSRLKRFFRSIARFNSKTSEKCSPSVKINSTGVARTFSPISQPSEMTPRSSNPECIPNTKCVFYRSPQRQTREPRPKCTPGCPPRESSNLRSNDSCHPVNRQRYHQLNCECEIVGAVTEDRNLLGTPLFTPFELMNEENELKAASKKKNIEKVKESESEFPKPNKEVFIVNPLYEDPETDRHRFSRNSVLCTCLKCGNVHRRGETRITTDILDQTQLNCNLKHLESNDPLLGRAIREKCEEKYRREYDNYGDYTFDYKFDKYDVRTLGYKSYPNLGFYPPSNFFWQQGYYYYNEYNLMNLFPKDYKHDDKMTRYYESYRSQTRNHKQHTWHRSNSPVCCRVSTSHIKVNHCTTKQAKPIPKRPDCCRARPQPPVICHKSKPQTPVFCCKHRHEPQNSYYKSKPQLSDFFCNSRPEPPNPCCKPRPRSPVICCKSKLPTPITCHRPKPPTPITCHRTKPPTPITCHRTKPPTPITCHRPKPPTPITCHRTKPPTPITCHRTKPPTPITCLRPKPQTPVTCRFSKPKTPVTCHRPESQPPITCHKPKPQPSLSCRKPSRQPSVTCFQPKPEPSPLFKGRSDFYRRFKPKLPISCFKLKLPCTPVDPCSPVPPCPPMSPSPSMPPSPPMNTFLPLTSQGRHKMRPASDCGYCNGFRLDCNPSRLFKFCFKRSQKKCCCNGNKKNYSDSLFMTFFGNICKTGSRKVTDNELEQKVHYLEERLKQIERGLAQGIEVTPSSAALLRVEPSTQLLLHSTASSRCQPQYHLTESFGHDRPKVGRSGSGREEKVLGNKIRGETWVCWNERKDKMKGLNKMKNLKVSDEKRLRDYEEAAFCYTADTPKISTDPCRKPEGIKPSSNCSFQLPRKINEGLNSFHTFWKNVRHNKIRRRVVNLVSRIRIKSSTDWGYCSKNSQTAYEYSFESKTRRKPKYRIWRGGYS